MSHESAVPAARQSNGEGSVRQKYGPVGFVLIILFMGLLTLTLSGCVGGGWGQPVYTPAHIERQYAAVSTRAFLEDGGYLVCNGHLLWRYSDTGVRQAETLLLPELTYADTLTPSELFVKNDRQIYLTLCGQTVERYSSEGIQMWAVDMHVDGAFPVPDGVLVYTNGDYSSTAILLDPEGEEVWSISGQGFNRYKAAADSTGRSYFISDKTLRAYSPAGEELWSYTVDDLYRPDIVGCTDDLIVIEDTKRLIGLDTQGTVVYRNYVPVGSTSYQYGAVTAGGRTVINLSGGIDGTECALLVVDALGNTVCQEDGMDVSRLVSFGEDEVVGLVYFGHDRYLAAFETDSLEQLWRYYLPKAEDSDYEDGAVVDVFNWDAYPRVRGDRVYLDWEGQHLVFDASGDLVDTIQPEAYSEYSVPATTAE